MEKQVQRAVSEAMLNSRVSTILEPLMTIHDDELQVTSLELTWESEFWNIQKRIIFVTVEKLKSVSCSEII